MSRRHRRGRWSDSWRRPRVSLSQRRLYRDPERGRLTGVCAGLSDYFGISRTMTRFVVIVGLIFAGGPTVVAYLLATLLLPTRAQIEDSAFADVREEPGPDLDTERSRMRAFDQRMKQEDYGELDAQRRAARAARERLAGIDGRLRNLEAYVTSRRFDLEREFGKL